MKDIFTLLLTFLLLGILESSYAQQRTISGKVTSGEDGSGLPGVNITVKGTSAGTVSDADGTYRLSVPEDATTLVFSFIGFRKAEVLIGNRTEVNVTLLVDTRQLNEVVVTSFGIQKERRN
ncbi:MAG: hypothetical protein OHK0057_13390 [Thermoflexibacter sp.]